MVNRSAHSLTRRSLLSGSLGVAGGLLAAPAWAQEDFTSANTSSWSRSVSANGWPVIAEAVPKRIEGSGSVSVSLAGGDPQLVLMYLLRRYLYEVAGMFDPGDVIGFRKSTQVRADYESNYLSGTAVEIFRDRYPLGIRNGLFPTEVALIRKILNDLDGVVSWGRDMDPVKESHFEITVPPSSGRLEQVIRDIRNLDADERASFGISMARQRE